MNLEIFKELLSDTFHKGWTKFSVTARKSRPEPPRVSLPVRTFGGDLFIRSLIEGVDVMNAHNAGKLRDTDVGKNVPDFAIVHRHNHG